MRLNSPNAISPNKRVAVLGANGQVGSELCLLLDIMGQVKPIAVARSAYSTSLLRSLGIESRHYGDNAASTLADLIYDCDGVVELVHPWQENTALMRREIETRAAVVSSGMKKSAPMIYCSTISVYHLDPNAPAYSIYGKTKRFAENQYRRACKQAGHETFILRLGQVHGLMQSCSTQLVQELRKSRKILVPNLPSFSVFVSSIAESVHRVMKGEVSPNSYTLISQPPWSYEELAQWWAQEAGLHIEVRKLAPASRTWRSSIGNVIAAMTRKIVYRHRDRLSDHAWTLSPDFAAKMRFRHHCSLAAASIDAYDQVAFSTPFIQKVSVPGNLFPGLSDSRITMSPLHALLQERLQQL
jgi:dTDP-4-dehydrorhamnose reductase